MNAIKWSARAAKQLRKLDPPRQRDVVTGVSQLVDMPYCPNIKALTRHQYGFRLRVGDYRVLFDWQGEIRIIEIQEVRKRDEHTY